MSDYFAMARLSNEELALVDTYADKYSLTRTQVVRKAFDLVTNNAEVEVKFKAFESLITLVNKVGLNLNSATYQINENGAFYLRTGLRRGKDIDELTLAISNAKDLILKTEKEYPLIEEEFRQLRTKQVSVVMPFPTRGVEVTRITARLTEQQNNDLLAISQETRFSKYELIRIGLLLLVSNKLDLKELIDNNIALLSKREVARLEIAVGRWHTNVNQMERTLEKLQDRFIWTSFIDIITREQLVKDILIITNSSNRLRNQLQEQLESLSLVELDNAR